MGVAKDKDSNKMEFEESHLEKLESSNHSA